MAVPVTDGETGGASADELRLALRAATMYYLDGLTQAEIATRLGVSRPTAGRLVARAKANGLVRIEVVVPPALRDDLHADEERELERRFGLAEAVVVAGQPVELPGDPAAYTGIGRAAAALLLRRLAPTDVLGITWGPEQAAVASALTSGVATCRTVVQLDGAITTGDYQTGTEFILGRCAQLLQAEIVRLPAPLYADPATVASLYADSMLSRTLDTGATADAMLFGVGPASTATTLFEGSFLDAGTLDDLIADGAVGEIGGRFFDLDGRAVDSGLQERTISAPLERIRACEKSILISAGAGRHRAVLGALRGGLAKLLVCDIDCARYLLQQ
ncbi:sugar-binding transcriptional regulator [Nocardia sp. NPDC058176]|uniref:sugar-binding transcriptional regulator n=1 Tax=Nocardia sp. NPDC058176 TaxID=3346368 RepID=UPI0036DDA6D6